MRFLAPTVLFHTLLALTLGGCSSTLSAGYGSDAATDAPTDAATDAVPGCAPGITWLDLAPYQRRVGSQPGILGLSRGGFALAQVQMGHVVVAYVPATGPWGGDTAFSASWADTPDGITHLALRETPDGLVVASTGYDQVRVASMPVDTLLEGCPRGCLGDAWRPVFTAPLPHPRGTPNDLAFAGDHAVAVLTHQTAPLPMDFTTWNDTYLRWYDLTTAATRDRVWPAATDLLLASRVVFDGDAPIVLGFQRTGTGTASTQQMVVFRGDAPAVTLDGCAENFNATVGSDHRLWITCGGLAVYALAPGGSTAPVYTLPAVMGDPWMSTVLPLADGGAMVAYFSQDQYLNVARLAHDGQVSAQGMLNLGFGRLNHPVALAQSPDGTFAVLWSRWGSGDVVRFRTCP